MIQFPKDFIWGSATSSFQIEGARKAGGKGPSIWDVFCEIPGKIANNDNGDIACDHFNRIEEDVALMKKMGLHAYRFSISWPRIQPDGKGAPNQEGIALYSKLIDELLRNDIEPWVTLYHWDLPAALQFEDEGWIGDNISNYFAKYANICFENFGDRVKNWITLNEPWVIAILGYGQGVFAPGIVSNSKPYLAGHNLILAHAKAVDIYRKKYAHQNGRIGITNNCDWREPLTDSPEDFEAAERALEFFLAWFADPIYKGKYPKSMIERLGNRLPEFSDEEIEIIKDSSDFFGLNHYTTMFARDAAGKLENAGVYGNGGLSEDQDVNLSTDKTWKKTAMGWAIVPWGCQKLLEWIDQRYDSPEIYITENGGAFPDKKINGEVNDLKRKNYYKGYLEACAKAIENGVNLKGYFAWSLMDNFEWASGYEKRFGIHYVDFQTLERTPKLSAKWLTEVISKNGFQV